MRDHQTPISNCHIVRLPTVIQLTGLSKSTIRRMELSGDFPQRKKLGSRAMGWKMEDINAWLIDPETYQQRKGGES